MSLRCFLEMVLLRSPWASEYIICSPWCRQSHNKRVTLDFLVQNALINFRFLEFYKRLIENELTVRAEYPAWVKSHCKGVTAFSLEV